MDLIHLLQQMGFNRWVSDQPLKLPSNTNVPFLIRKCSYFLNKRRRRISRNLYTYRMKGIYVSGHRVQAGRLEWGHACRLGWRCSGEGRSVVRRLANSIGLLIFVKAKVGRAFLPVRWHYFLGVHSLCGELR